MSRVFVSTWGQNDNLGDSVLRRGLLDAVRTERSEMHVFVGDNDDGYLTALGLRGDETLYRSRSEWWRSAMSRLLTRKTFLVQTAGELVFSGSKPHAGWRTLVGVAGARVAGGGGVQVGAGVRDPAGGVPALERRARRALSIVAWRDTPSQEAFGMGEVVPDWAFGEGADPRVLSREGRDLLTVTVRGDRPGLKSSTIALLTEVARERNLGVQVVTQVRRDTERASELARAFGGELKPVVWADESHAGWEEVVRETYRRSLIVASDRAHVLIIGATEGALPLGVSGTSIEKVLRIVAPAEFTMPSQESGISDYLEAELDGEYAVPARVAAAQVSLASVKDRIQRLVAG